jgi:DNA polymerase III sliding clamp (beta) subunit (PCNA family)
MNLDRKKLQACLNSLSKVMANNKKPIKPIYKNVQFIITSNKLSLYAMDGEHFITSLYGDIENEDSSFMVEYETINKLVSLSEVEEIKFDFKETSIKIALGKSKYTLQYFIGQDFKFFIDDIETKEQTLVLTETVENITSAISFVSPVINNGSEQNKFKGIYFDGNFVAADTSGVAVHYISESEGTFFVPKESFSLISSLSKDTTVDIFTTGTHVIIESKFNKLIIPILVQEFPNYKNIVNKVNKYTLSFTVDKEQFIKACSRIKLFSDDSIKQHGLFKISADEITLTANSSNKEGEEIIEAIEIVISENPVEILVDFKRFIDYISNISSETITLQFTEVVNKSQPILIKGDCLPFYIESSLVKRNLNLV